MKLGAAFGWHVHPWETTLELVERAEELGYAAAFVDGDVSMLGSTREADVLDGWTATVALIAKTRRIQLGSIRLVHHWNAARLAQAAATVERIAPGRQRLMISIGDRPHDERFGLPSYSRGERIRWLDETLRALRALWSGEAVTLDGRYVQLDRARVSPAPPGGIPIAIAAQGPKMLELVAEHADVWEINLPPLPERVSRAERDLARACDARGRRESEIERSMWIFTRLLEGPDPEPIRTEFRRLNPWFDWLSDEEVDRAVVVGDAETCGARLAAAADVLRLDLAVLDLSGADATASFRVLEALAPEKLR